MTVTSAEVPTEIILRGRHTDLTDRFREHATEAAQKLDRFGIPLQRIEVEITHEHNPRMTDRAFKVEFTCRANGSVVRAEAAADHDLSALDRAVDRVEQRLRRAADRRNTRSRRAHREIVVPPLQPDDVLSGSASGGVAEAGGDSVSGSAALEALHDPDVVFADGPIIVRQKTHDTRPMTVEQALDEMEQLDHDFFLFHDIDADGVAVVYRRHGYAYGLLRLTLTDDAGGRHRAE